MMQNAKSNSSLSVLINETNGAGLNTFDLEQIKEDIQNLLNTRRCLDEDYRCLVPNLLQYGLPDFSQFRPESEADQQELADEVENTIKQFEPRLQAVSVKLDPQINVQRKHLVVMHIKAMFHSNQASIPVRLESQLETSSARFKIKGMKYE